MYFLLVCKRSFFFLRVLGFNVSNLGHGFGPSSGKKNISIKPHCINQDSAIVESILLEYPENFIFIYKF